MITKYTKKDGTTAYKLQAYLGIDPITGKQVRTTRQGFKTQREAKRAETKLVEEFQRQGTWKRNDKITFNEVAELWFEQYKNTVKKSTYHTNTIYFKKHIKPVFGHLQFSKINIAICQRFVNNLANTSAFGTYRSLANRIFKYAIHLGIIDNSPLDKVIIPKSTHIPKRETTENHYTKDELTHFLEIIEENESLERLLFYRILAFGGLRVGEATALEKDDFDFTNNTISINKTFAQIGEGWTIQSPKTKKSTRTISMDAKTMQLAKSYLTQCIKPLHGHFRVFTVTPSGAREWLRRTLNKHGLKHITLHGFRHTHASLLFETGVPAKVTQERLGHAKISITLDLYTHLSKSQKDEVADKLADFIAI
ncbi:site-specific integrase [Streptococcus marmotae]|uniref:site-specific integrase n=1 Tax=Streptococcus marmotae TaxID=1825069 RepID=UPI00082AAAE8|nr:site-specific integrase [Streptococcus marmotae]QBX16877.1 mobile element protein [Streptococcus phage Javan291]